MNQNQNPLRFNPMTFAVEFHALASDRYVQAKQGKGDVRQAKKQLNDARREFLAAREQRKGQGR